MKPTLLARLGAVATITVTGFAGVAPLTNRDSYSFSADLTGVVRSTISGKATFGRVDVPDAPDVFTLTLGTDSSEGAVLFTQPNGTKLSVGSYRISDAGGDSGLQALVLLGRSDRPTGVFRVQSGILTITSVSDHVITGVFSLDGAGFLAAAPERENQRVYVSGSFNAESDD